MWTKKKSFRAILFVNIKPCTKKFCKRIMTTLMFKQTKNVNDKVKDLIFGYVKRIEKQHLQLEMEVPVMISYVILLFYFENEYFDKPGQGIIISKDKMTITKQSNADVDFDNTTYCKNTFALKSNSNIKW
eukprot:348005_1